MRPKLPCRVVPSQAVKLVRTLATGEEMVLVQEFLRGPQLFFSRVASDMFPMKPGGGVLEK